MTHSLPEYAASGRPATTYWEHLDLLAIAFTSVNAVTAGGQVSGTHDFVDAQGRELLGAYAPAVGRGRSPRSSQGMTPARVTTM